jgi:hypothetical protein
LTSNSPSSATLISVPGKGFPTDPILLLLWKFKVAPAEVSVSPQPSNNGISKD